MDFEDEFDRLRVDASRASSARQTKVKMKRKKKKIENNVLLQDGPDQRQIEEKVTRLLLRLSLSKQTDKHQKKQNKSSKIDI